MKYVVTSDSPLRLDTFLAQETGLSRSQISAFIKKGVVKIYGEYATKPGTMVKNGDPVYFTVPTEENDGLIAEEIPLDVIYEDEVMLIINKAANIIVHPAINVPSGTLANALKHYLKDDPATIQGFNRPGLVHRLDRDTTGLLMVAKTPEAMHQLTKDIKMRNVKKLYITFLEGKLEPDKGEIHAPIHRDPKDRKKMAVGGEKAAYTLYHVADRVQNPAISVCKVRIITGRTHQIRVHFSSIGYPVMGDETYNTKRNPLPAPRQMLHAATVEFRHPITRELMSITAPIPDDMKECIGHYNITPHESWYDLSDFD